MKTAGVWFERVGVALALLITTLFAATIAMSAIAVHSGYQAVAMVSDSMRPTIGAGDLVVIRQTAPAQIRVGDMITFAAPVQRSPLVTHRVVSIETTASGPVFKTKGDANQSPDMWTIHYSRSAWKVTQVLPGGGAALDFMQGDGGRVVIGVLIFIIVLALIGPWGTRRDDALAPAGAG
jgi:signal peptidase